MSEGDTIVFTFSEPIDPHSIITDWDGTGSRNVVVRAYDNGLLGLPLGDDELVVYNAANNAALGTVDLGRGDYVSGVLGGHILFGATGNFSTITMTPDKRTVTIMLGAYSRTSILGASVGNASGPGTMVWTPAAGLEDLAGNAIATTTATESGTADEDF
jgi:hypothetical protein